MVQKNKLMLIIAIFLGIMSAVLLHSHIKGLKQSVYKGMKLVNVVVAKKNLPKRTVLEKSLVAARKIPSKFLPTGAVLVKDCELILGQPTQVSLRAGEPILWSYVGVEERKTFSTRIPGEKRAVTIGVDELTGVGGMIEPYDHVDVLMTFASPGPSKTEVTTITLLQDIPVLALGQEESRYQPLSFAGKKGYSSVTLCLSPLEAELITFAQEHGSLSLTLRNPEDRAREEIPVMNFDYLNNSIKSGAQSLRSGTGDLSK